MMILQAKHAEARNQEVSRIFTEEWFIGSNGAVSHHRIAWISYL